MTSAFGVGLEMASLCGFDTDMGKGEEGVTIIDILADVIYNWPHSLSVVLFYAYKTESDWLLLS